MSTTKAVTINFAYGSNLDAEQMATRAPGARLLGWARLRDWELQFRGVANVCERQGSEVLGALWSLTPNDLRRIDRYEGYPHLYSKRHVIVETEHGNRNAMVYVMTGTKGTRTSYGLAAPSDFYLRGIRNGYRQMQLPEALLDAAVAASRPQTSFHYDVPRELNVRSCQWCENTIDDPDLFLQLDDTCFSCWQEANSWYERRGR